LYNDCLAEHKEAYAERGETIGKFAQLQKVKEIKDTSPHVKGIQSPVMQNEFIPVLSNVITGFFSRLRIKNIFKNISFWTALTTGYEWSIATCVRLLGSYFT
jgi:hypothetical protein